MIIAEIGYSIHIILLKMLTRENMSTRITIEYILRLKLETLKDNTMLQNISHKAL